MRIVYKRHAAEGLGKDTTATEWNSSSMQTAESDGCWFHDDTQRPMFSLVVATVGRSAPLHRLLVSLKKQTYDNFEVIVVDQNADDTALAVITDVGLSNVSVIRSPKGLSRARNVGLAMAKGAIIAFPDDDCWYAANTLQRVITSIMSSTKPMVVIGRLCSEGGRQIKPRRRFRSGRLTRLRAILDVSASSTMFIPSFVLSRAGGFDERLGLGANTPWVGAEDLDVILRVRGHGYPLVYDDSVVVYHPEFSRSSQASGRRYGQGFGATLRKNRLPRYVWLAELSRSMAGMFLYTALRQHEKAGFYLEILKGKWYGWRTWPCRSK